MMTLNLSLELYREFIYIVPILVGRGRRTREAKPPLRLTLLILATAGIKDLQGRIRRGAKPPLIKLFPLSAGEGDKGGEA